MLMQSAAEFVVHADVGGLRRRWWSPKDAATPQRIADKARRIFRGVARRLLPSVAPTWKSLLSRRHEGALPMFVLAVFLRRAGAGWWCRWW